MGFPPSVKVCLIAVLMLFMMSVAFYFIAGGWSRPANVGGVSKWHGMAREKGESARF